MARGKGKKVWMEKAEVDELIMACPRLRDRLMVEIGCFMGLRMNEIAKANIKDIREYTVDGKTKKFLKVYGKKTDQKKGAGEKKFREVLIPDRVASDIVMLKNQEGLEGDDPIVPNRYGDNYNTTGMRLRIKKLGQMAHEETGIEKFKHLSSHDMRRFYAQYNLVTKSRNPRIVMDQGGWKHFKSIKPYLNKPTKSVVIREMEE